MDRFGARLDYAASTLLAIVTGGWLLLMAWGLVVSVAQGDTDGLGWFFWLVFVLLPALLFWLGMHQRAQAIAMERWLDAQEYGPDVVINVQQDYQPPVPRPRDP